MDENLPHECDASEVAISAALWTENLPHGVECDASEVAISAALWTIIL